MLISLNIKPADNIVLDCCLCLVVFVFVLVLYLPILVASVIRNIMFNTKQDLLGDIGFATAKITTVSPPTMQFACRDVL